MAAYLHGTHHPYQARPPRVAYVALVHQVVVGYIAGHLTHRYGCDGEVQYLFVTPAHRRRGVAAQLLRLQAQWFREHQAGKICVNVAPKNAAARTFYARQGATEFNPFWYVWNDIGSVISGAA